MQSSLGNSIHYTVGYLSAVPGIKHGTYTLYANVPVKAVSRSDTGKSPLRKKDFVRGRASTTLDLVLCHGEDILMCILLSDSKYMRDIMDNTLNGMAYVSIDANEVLSKKMKDVGNFVNLNLSHLERDPKSVSLKYSLSSVSSLKAICNDIEPADGKPLYELLVENGRNTYFGDLCGVFYRYEVNPQTEAVTHFPVIAQCSQSDLKLDIYSEHLSADGKMPLNKRIDFLYRGLPSSPEAAEDAVKSLQELLNAPLEEIFQNRPKWFQNFQEDIIKIKEHANNYSMSCRNMELETYRDTMEFLYSYINESRACDNCSDEQVSLNCLNLFTDLVCGMEPSYVSDEYKEDSSEPMPKTMSLESRIKRLNAKQNVNYSILHVHVGTYFYAASFLGGSSYTRAFYENVLAYREMLLEGSNISKKTLLKIARAKLSSNIESNMRKLSFMRTFFLEPICNPNQIIKVKEV